MIRAFLALDLEERLLDEVASLADRLRGRSRLSHAKWVARGAMHVTVRFLGDTDDAAVPGIREAVRELGARWASAELRVRARALDAFPEPRRAKVLVLDLEEPRGVLEAIAKGAEAIAVASGSPPERRPFVAHLTLARIREGADLRELVAATPVDLEGRVEALTLYQSELGKGEGGGPRYTALERAMFP